MATNLTSKVSSAERCFSVARAKWERSPQDAAASLFKGLKELCDALREYDSKAPSR